MVASTYTKLPKVETMTIPHQYEPSPFEGLHCDICHIFTPRIQLQVAYHPDVSRRKRIGGRHTSAFIICDECWKVRPDDTRTIIKIPFHDCAGQEYINIFAKTHSLIPDN